MDTRVNFEFFFIDMNISLAQRYILEMIFILGLKNKWQENETF